MVNETIKSICTFVKTFGSSGPAKLSNGRMFYLELNLESFKSNDVVNYDGIYTRWLDLVCDPKNGFKRKADVMGVRPITYSYSISNWDKGDRLLHFVPEKDRKLPDDVGVLSITIPSEEYDRILGKDAIGGLENLMYGGKEIKINMYPKKIEIRLWDATDRLPD